MNVEEFRQRLVNAGARFSRKISRVDPAPEEPSPEEHRNARLREFFSADAASDLLVWLDSQIALAKLQRTDPKVLRDHPSLLTTIGFESGLEAVKAAILNWRNPPPA